MSCEICRPGGMELTAELFSGIPLTPRLRVLDAGCGQGATLCLLHERYGITGTGVDTDCEALSVAAEACPDVNWIHGDFLSAALAPASYDVLLFECSFSKIDPPADAARLAYSLLAPGGSLILSDLYAREAEMKLSGSIGRLEHLDRICGYFEQAGFTVGPVTDCSSVLKAYAAQMFFSQEETALSRDLTANRSELMRAKPGYFILKAVKPLT